MDFNASLADSRRQRDFYRRHTDRATKRALFALSAAATVFFLSVSWGARFDGYQAVLTSPSWPAFGAIGLVGLPLARLAPEFRLPPIVGKLALGAIPIVLLSAILEMSLFTPFVRGQGQADAPRLAQVDLTPSALRLRFADGSELSSPRRDNAQFSVTTGQCVIARIVHGRLGISWIDMVPARSSVGDHPYVMDCLSSPT